MHQEVLALAETAGILFSRESPDLGDGDETEAALSEEVGGPQLIPATGVSGRMFTLTAGTFGPTLVSFCTSMLTFCSLVLPWGVVAQSCH